MIYNSKTRIDYWEVFGSSPFYRGPTPCFRGWRIACVNNIPVAEPDSMCKDCSSGRLKSATHITKYLPSVAWYTRFQGLESILGEGCHLTRPSYVEIRARPDQGSCAGGHGPAVKGCGDERLWRNLFDLKRNMCERLKTLVPHDTFLRPLWDTPLYSLFSTGNKTCITYISASTIGIYTVGIVSNCGTPNLSLCNILHISMWC